MAQLDEIWNLVHHTDSVTPIWGERRFDSPLASVPGPVDVDGELTDPLSAVTLRIRHTDVPLAGKSMTRSGDDRVWVIGETLEVGRRQWIDLGLATYPAGEGSAVVPDPTPVDPMPDPDYTPPVGWNWVKDGAPFRRLTIAGVSVGQGGRRGGTFTSESGVTGSMGTALDIGGDRWMLGVVVRTSQFMYWSWASGEAAYTAEWGFAWVMREGKSLDWNFGSSSFPTASDTETATSHPLFTGDEVLLATDAQWQTFFK